jgi:hypothetical protein
MDRGWQAREGRRSVSQGTWESVDLAKGLYIGGDRRHSSETEGGIAVVTCIMEGV